MGFTSIFYVHISGYNMPNSFISKRIIELHGGNIWAESEGIGAGTTFYFTFPRSTH